MRRYLIALCLVFGSLLCLGVVIDPVDLLQQAMPGSSAGQPLVSTGANTAPVFGTDLATATTIGSAYIYRAGGTDVPFTDGGTGLSSWTQYLIPYAATTTSIGQIAIGTAGQPLLSGGAGVAPAFGSDLATATTIGAAYIYRAAGTDVPVTDGGTGVSTLTTAYGLLAAGTTATGAVQTLPAGLTTQMLVGGGVAALPDWQEATGTGAPVRAGSPTLTGTPLVGTTAAGGNLTINATEGSEMAPTLEAVNWTCTDGWSAGTGTLVKIAGAGTGTATPSGAFSVSVDVTYLVTITCSAVSGSLTYTLGGNSGRTITATTFTDAITASTTAKIIFSGGAAVTATITSVSVKALTNDTGDLDVYGNARFYSPIQSPDGTDTITLSGGKVGIGTTKPGQALQVGTNFTVTSSGAASTSTLTSTGYVYGSVGVAGGGAASSALNLLSTVGAGTTDYIALRVGNAGGTQAIRVINNGNVGIANTAPATKLDQAQFSADALGSYHTFSKSRHATQGSHTIVQDNDGPSGIQGAMSDGVDFGTIAWRVHGETDDDAPDASSIGGAVVLSTAAGAGTDDLAEHWRLDKNGDINHTSSNGGRMDTQCLVQTVTIAAAASSGATTTITIPAGAVVENITWRVTQAAGGGPTAMNIYYTQDANDLDCLCDNSAITLNTTGDIYTKGDLTYMHPTALHRTEAYTLTVQLHDGSNVATNVTGASFIIRIQCWLKKWVAPTS